MKKVLTFLKREFLELLPPTIFFLVVFHIFGFMRVLIGEQDGITITSSATATIGALIVGKSILIADALPLFNWFRQKRLIYNVAWRIFMYAMIALLLQLLEELIPIISKYGTISMVSEQFLEGINWSKFWASHILLIVFLAVYSLATAVIDAIGRDKFVEIFFRPNSNPLSKIE